MRSYNGFLFFLSVVFVTITFSDAFAVDEVTLPAGGDNVNAAVPSFPYVAEITGNDVCIRSGAGTNYYDCGKLHQGMRVRVVSMKYGIWSQIVPPTGCFSWISKQYVEVSVDDPNVGVVTGDSVRVRAGSSNGNPLHSRTVQLTVGSGD